MSTFAILRSKLERSQPVTVGYLGGSITMAGNDAPPTGRSWRARTTAMLMEKYPDCPITEINAGISGTGSDFGVFRCESQLLCHKPDLLFVEFAVNDGGTDPARVAKSYEGIIRRFRIACPESPIIAMMMLNSVGHPQLWEKGEESPIIALHARIAEAYGVPVVYNGRTLHEAIVRGDLTQEEALADVVHPLPAGHAIYAQEAFACLVREMDAAEDVSIAPLPARLDPLCWEDARLYPACLAESEGFAGAPLDMWGYHLYMMTADKPGATLRMNFTGRVLGLFWIVDRDAGQVEVQIDGGETITVSAWDETVIQYPNRLCYTILAEDLPLGEHTVELRTAEKLPESTGNFIRIASFMLA